MATNAAATGTATTGRDRIRGTTITATTAPEVAAVTPTAPLGHGTVGVGRSAPHVAIAAMPAAGQPAHHASTSASPIHQGATTAAATPPMVAGATSGAASRFAGTETRLISPDNATSTGVTTIWAAIGTARATADHDGNHDMVRCHRGTRTRIPPVASTDIAKPGDRASHGSTMTRTITAVANAGSPRRRPATVIPTTAIVPIAAARMTLGSGRANRTKPMIASNPRTGIARPRTPHHRARPRATTKMIVTLVPDTAVK